MKSRPIHVDPRFMPLLYVRYLRQASDDEFEAYLDQLRELLYLRDASERAVIIDATFAAIPTPYQRRMQAHWQRAHEERIAQLTKGIAFVIPSALMRGVLTGIFWLQALPCPHEVFKTASEAIGWCVSQLEAHGTPVDGRLVSNLAAIARLPPDGP